MDGPIITVDVSKGNCHYQPFLEKGKPLRKPKILYDTIEGFGELFSTTILTDKFLSLGITCQWLDARTFVQVRDGVVDEPETYARLAEHPNIAGIKEANSDISKIVTTAALIAGKLDLYSGNDDQTVPILSLGGKGVISVLSNLLPAQTAKMCRLYFEGDTAGAAALQLKYLPLIHALFSEVNPIPAKAAMSAMGWCENYLRMPLTPMEDAHKQKLFALMRDEGLI